MNNTDQTPSGAPRPAEHPSYWDYDQDAILECSACGWSGPGRGHEELFRDLFDVRCPECERILLVVAYPTNDATRTAAATGNSRAISALPEVEKSEELRRHRNRFELSDPAALPDLVDDALVIEWDLVDGWTVLRHGDVELWREPVYYEGEERFEAVAAILQAKYGDRLVEFRPTTASEFYLYGDRSTGGVIRVNEALRAHRAV